MSVIAASAGVILLCGLLLVLLSVGSVDQNEYGLVYNWITKQISRNVVHGGTHMIGFWNSFVTFPATVQTIEFSDRIGMRTAERLHTRTKEGLGLHLSISFQYLLTKDSLPDLYEMTNIQYEGLFARIARDQLLEAAAEYEGPQYWQNRRNIGDHMRQLVDKKLKESFSELWGLQLLVIDLPDRYEKSITMTQVQNQIIQTRRSQQVAASIRADTEVLQAEFTRDIQVVRADAQANFTLETKLAQAEAARRKIAAEAEALGYARQKLGLSPKGAVEYSEMMAYGQLENATFLANVPGIMPTIGVGGATGGASFLQRGRSQRQTSQASLVSGDGVQGAATLLTKNRVAGTAGQKADKEAADVHAFFSEAAAAVDGPFPRSPAA